jgi:hypothetical protein
MLRGYDFLGLSEQKNGFSSPRKPAFDSIFAEIKHGSKIDYKHHLFGPSFVNP